MITSLISMALLGDNLDLLTISVEGDGLLRFVKDSKTVYCRNATLVNSPQGLATSDGALLVPRIILPEMTSDVFIDFDGTITAQFGRKYQEVGHLYLANFSKNVELTQSGNYLTTLSKPKLTQPGDGLTGVIRSNLEFGTLVSATGNPYDLLLQGPGYFQFQERDGSIKYSRDGKLHLDVTGLLVDRHGNPLIPMVTIPQNSTQVCIGADGTVEVLLQGSQTPTKIEIIQLAKFEHPWALKRLSTDYFAATKASGAPNLVTAGANQSGTILSGYISGFQSLLRTNSQNLKIEVKK